MGYKERDTVVLTRKIRQHALLPGDLGAIVHAHASDCFEVEFIRASGKTQALVRLSAADLRPVKARDLIAVRQIGGREG